MGKCQAQTISSSADSPGDRPNGTASAADQVRPAGLGASGPRTGTRSSRTASATGAALQSPAAVGSTSFSELTNASAASASSNCGSTAAGHGVHSAIEPAPGWPSPSESFSSASPVPPAVRNGRLTLPPSTAQPPSLIGVTPSQPTTFCRVPSSQPCRSLPKVLVIRKVKLASGSPEASASSGTNGVQASRATSAGQSSRYSIRANGYAPVNLVSRTAGQLTGAA